MAPPFSRTAAGLPRKQTQPAQILTLYQARIPVELRWQMERRAAVEGTTLSSVLKSALHQYLNPAPAAPRAE